MKTVDSRTLKIEEIEALKAINKKLSQKEEHSTSHTATNTYSGVMQEPPTKRLKVSDQDQLQNYQKHHYWY